MKIQADDKKINGIELTINNNIKINEDYRFQIYYLNKKIILNGGKK